MQQQERQRQPRTHCWPGPRFEQQGQEGRPPQLATHYSQEWEAEGLQMELHPRQLEQHRHWLPMIQVPPPPMAQQEAKRAAR